MHKCTSIEDLLQDCIKGEPLAWSRFVENFSNLIFWAIKKKTNYLHLTFPENDICDIYQQVLLSIWHKRKLETIRDLKNIGKWLIIVTQNETANYIKNKLPLKEIKTIDETDCACESNPLEETHKDELEREIEFFIDALPLKERRVATLDILYELKYAQISKIVNIPLGTIASMIKRIKVQLKQHLVDKGYTISACQ